MGWKAVLLPALPRRPARAGGLPAYGLPDRERPVRERSRASPAFQGSAARSRAAATAAFAFFLIVTREDDAGVPRAFLDSIWPTEATCTAAMLEIARQEHERDRFAFILVGCLPVVGT